MSIKDYLVKTCGISEERFDQLVETACKIKDGGVPICHKLSDPELFELFVSYGRANREKKGDWYL